MLMVLSFMVALASMVCFIMVLVKQFQIGGALQGIIGIITCGLWTLIWGWINAGKGKFTNLMVVWTLLTIVNLILNAVVGFNFDYSQMGD